MMINGRRNKSRNSHPAASYYKFTLAQCRVELRSFFLPLGRMELKIVCVHRKKYLDNEVKVRKDAVEATGRTGNDAVFLCVLPRQPG